MLKLLNSSFNSVKSVKKRLFTDLLEVVHRS